MSTENRMSATFDNEAEYNEKIAPHIQAIWQECERLGLPCVLSVCYANKPKDGGAQSGIALAVHLNGEERTPPSFVISEMAISESPMAAAAFIFSEGLLGVVQEIRGKRPGVSDDLETPANQTVN